jgi:hypothetical protein
MKYTQNTEIDYDLLTGRKYNKLIRPVGNSSQKLNVKMGIRLSQLIDIVSTLILWLVYLMLQVTNPVDNRIFFIIKCMLIMWKNRCVQQNIINVFKKIVIMLYRFHWYCNVNIWRTFKLPYFFSYILFFEIIFFNRFLFEKWFKKVEVL